MSGKENIYFLGIGGIGMSGLARYFHVQGKRVVGYDKTPSAVTDALIQEGISISFLDETESFPPDFTPDNCTVVYTPAIPTTSVLWKHVRKQNFTLQKRAQVLGQITKNSRTLAIAGTHGKTTTSCMLAHILNHANEPINAFLGGIATNYNSNVILHAEGQQTVVEADEFDRSFLTLFPAVAAITSTDADHLDIYGQHEELLEGFRLFSNQVSDKLYIHEAIDAGIFTKETITYGLSAQADVRAKNIHVSKGNFIFDFTSKHTRIEKINLSLPGEHNVLNATVALAIALREGLTPDQAKAGIESFRGVKRRFETHLSSEKIAYIDDYAHHPTEINAAIHAARQLYPNRKLVVVFQPHLFSRTKDFGIEFAQSLSKADEVVLTEIYPARELPIPGIDSKWLLDMVSISNKCLASKNEITDRLNIDSPTVVLTLGAGDIDREVKPIADFLSKISGE